MQEGAGIPGAFLDWLGGDAGLVVQKLPEGGSITAADGEGKGRCQGIHFCPFLPAAIQWCRRCCPGRLRGAG